MNERLPRPLPQDETAAMEHKGEQKELTNQEKLLRTILSSEESLSSSIEHEEQFQWERQELEKVFSQLSKESQQIIRMIHGLNKDGTTHSWRETAKAVGFTQARTIQIHDKAIKKLSELLQEKGE